MDYDVIQDFIFTPNAERREELRDDIVAYWIQMFLNEFYYFAGQNSVNTDDIEIDSVLMDYAQELIQTLDGMRTRVLAKAEKEKEEYGRMTDDELHAVLIDYINNQYKRIEETETSNVIQFAQILVADRFQKDNPGAEIYKRWIANPDCCPICKALSEQEPIPLDEPFLVNGQRVELPDGKVFIYDYVDRLMCIAHPNDRCRIQFILQ